jgi:uncharacterized protein YgbK (DUF1537 family)
MSDNPDDRLVVLADDLTGAMASAGALAMATGHPVPVAREAPASWSDCLVLNTESRDQRASEASFRRRVRPLVNTGVRCWDRRMDTTLRGRAAEELRWLAALLPREPFVVIAPAYPEAGRRTRSGVQYRGEEVVGRLEDAVEAEALARQIWGTPRVDRLDPTSPDLAPPHRPGVYLADAESPAHVQRIAALINQLARRSEPLVLATSGAMLKYWSVPRRNVAVVLGSDTATNRRQLAHVQAWRECRVSTLWDPPQPAEGRIRVLKAWPSAHEAGPATDRLVAEAVAAHLAVWQAQGWRPDRLVMSGGATAQAVINGIGAHQVLAHRLSAPLVGWGLAVGGPFDGLEVVTKGGMVGSEDLLLDLVLLTRL